jgi:dUTP pyrophosphatase
MCAECAKELAAKVNGRDIAGIEAGPDSFTWEPAMVSSGALAALEAMDVPAPRVPLAVSGTLQAPPYAGDCGLDLVTAKACTLHENQWQDIPCGVSVAMPPGTFGWICARSSTWTKWGIIVIPGVIDEGWRGELFTMAYRPGVAIRAGSDFPGYSKHGTVLPAGTRLAQLIVLPNLMRQVKLIQVDTLPESERGRRGFGSSGT